jgi:RNA polymerase-interacting CarD/CdnL/TRCF family regulator
MEGSMGLERSKKQETKNLFEIADTVVFGTRGIYRVDNIETMEIGKNRQKFYSLVQVYSKTIHRNLVSESSKDMLEIRPIITADEYFKLGTQFDRIHIDPLEFGLNSNKKIQAYTAWIHEEGFMGLVKVYLATCMDISKNPKIDKRLKQFNKKVRGSIIEEVATALTTSLVEAEETLKKVFLD